MFLKISWGRHLLVSDGMTLDDRLQVHDIRTSEFVSHRQTTCHCSQDHQTLQTTSHLPAMLQCLQRKFVCNDLLPAKYSEVFELSRLLLFWSISRLYFVTHTTAESLCKDIDVWYKVESEFSKIVQLQGTDRDQLSTVSLPCPMISWNKIRGDLPTNLSSE